MKCDQCDSATINGVFCHERGCPNKPILRDCFVCGYEFESPPGTYCRICPDCEPDADA